MKLRLSIATFQLGRFGRMAELLGLILVLAVNAQQLARTTASVLRVSSLACDTP